MGLGLAVAAFIGFNLVAGEETATAQEAIKEVVGKVADIPAAITGEGSRCFDIFTSQGNGELSASCKACSRQLICEGYFISNWRHMSHSA